MAENFFTSIEKHLQKISTKQIFTDYLKTTNLENITICLTRTDEISDLICLLNSSKSVGPCSIPTKILKIATEIVTLPLSKIINKGIFLNICKLAPLIPIFKNDPRLLCINYRPILLLSNVRKNFEKVTHCRLNLFLEQNSCVYPFQFGFRQNYSASNALVAIVESMQKQLHTRSYTAGLFFDLKKADTLDHNILLEKLEYKRSG